jgi:hypothetical protein
MSAKPSIVHQGHAWLEISLSRKYLILLNCFRRVYCRLKILALVDFGIETGNFSQTDVDYCAPIWRGK